MKTRKCRRRWKIGFFAYNIWGKFYYHRLFWDNFSCLVDELHNFSWVLPVELCNFYFNLILLFNVPSMLETVVELNIKGCF